MKRPALPAFLFDAEGSDGALDAAAGAAGAILAAAGR